MLTLAISRGGLCELVSTAGCVTAGVQRSTGARGRGSSWQDVTAVRALWLCRSCSEPLGSGLLHCAPGELCFSEYQPGACWTH